MPATEIRIFPNVRRALIWMKHPGYMQPIEVAQFIKESGKYAAPRIYIPRLPSLSVSEYEEFSRAASVANDMALRFDADAGKSVYPEEVDIVLSKKTQCDGKKPYTVRADGYAAIANMTIGGMNELGSLVVYKCPHCKMFHVGNRGAHILAAIKAK